MKRYIVALHSLTNIRQKIISTIAVRLFERRRSSDVSVIGSGRVITGSRERIEKLTALISERDAAIAALEYEVQHLTNDLQNHTRVRYNDLYVVKLYTVCYFVTVTKGDEVCVWGGYRCPLQLDIASV